MRNTLVQEAAMSDHTYISNKRTGMLNINLVGRLACGLLTEGSNALVHFNRQVLDKHALCLRWFSTFALRKA
eukprot:1763546-Amphidinium_carterae.1